MSAVLKYVVPIVIGIAVLTLWEMAVRHYQVPVFVLPAPSVIWHAFIDNFSSLMVSLWTTLRITWIAFALAFVSALASVACCIALA